MRKKQGGRSDNNTDPDLSAKAHNHTQRHMQKCDKHKGRRLQKHEDTSTIRFLA